MVQRYGQAVRETAPISYLPGNPGAGRRGKKHPLRRALLALCCFRQCIHHFKSRQPDAAHLIMRELLCREVAHAFPLQLLTGHAHAGQVQVLAVAVVLQKQGSNV